MLLYIWRSFFLFSSVALVQPSFSPLIWLSYCTLTRTVFYCYIMFTLSSSLEDLLRADVCPHCAQNWVLEADFTYIISSAINTKIHQRYQQTIFQSHRCIKKLYNFSGLLCFQSFSSMIWSLTGPLVKAGCLPVTDRYSKVLVLCPHLETDKIVVFNIM